MLKYVSKFTLDVLPSLLATVIGAYIVNHYIAAKPDAPAAATASTTEPKAEAKAAEAKAAEAKAGDAKAADVKVAAPEPAKADGKSDSKPPETSSDVVNIPEPGVRAKGISEKAVLEKSATEKPAETASIPVEPRRHQAAPREKTMGRTVSAPAVVPVIAAPNVVLAPTPVQPVEAAAPAEERHDANDLARAAIDRLRGLTDNSPHGQEGARATEASRAPDGARIPEVPRVLYASPAEAPRAASVPAVRPLPPPIMVSTPAGGAPDLTAGSSQGRSPYEAARSDDPRRPTPPADIPDASQPLDLRAEAAEPQPRQHRNVAEDMLSAARSVFHPFLPK